LIEILPEKKKFTMSAESAEADDGSVVLLEGEYRSVFDAYECIVVKMSIWIEYPNTPVDPRCPATNEAISRPPGIFSPSLSNSCR
jgi:hypothetical protein